MPVLNCRDRNRIALNSDLLGLRALGVESLLLTRGHRVPPEHPIIANAVFDTRGRELVAMAARLGESEPSPPGENFHIGVGARVIRPRENWGAAWLNERAEAGAQFLQTQLCLNLDMLQQYLAALVDARLTWKYSVVVTLAVLPSAQTARWLKQNMSDVRIPKSIIARLESSADEAAEGLAIAVEMMQQVAAFPAVSGIHLMTLGDAAALPKAIRRAGFRS